MHILLISSLTGSRFSYFWRYCAPVAVLRTEEFGTACNTAYAFVGAFAKLRETTANLVMSVRPFVCLSVRLEQRASHWTNIYKFDVVLTVHRR